MADSWGVWGLWEKEPNSHQHEPEGDKGPLPACLALLEHHRTGPQSPSLNTFPKGLQRPE